MDKLLRAIVLVPVITGVMQGIKQLIPASFHKFLWIITCSIGIGAAYLYVFAMQIIDMNNAMIIFGGIIAGLSASGLYEATKNTIKSINN